MSKTLAPLIVAAGLLQSREEPVKAQRVGSEQVRYYTFSRDGNQLTLSLESGERVTQTLTWERLRQRNGRSTASSRRT